MLSRNLIKMLFVAVVLIFDDDFQLIDSGISSDRHFTGHIK